MRSEGSLAEGGSAAALAAECRRALAIAAGAQGAGTRRERRARARAFVQRHRGDTSYLRWVLHSLAKSSALAVTLLGLATAPASAGEGTTLFIEQTGAANPLDGEDLGSGTTPVLVDLDADGDLDVVTGSSTDLFSWYQNTGSANNPVFAAAVSVTGGNVGTVPALGDLDGDGDSDLIAGIDFGAGDGTFRYYENVGSATSHDFLELTGAANPLDGEDVGSRSHPTLGDLDGDGDLDLVAGGLDGLLRYYENTGDPSSPAFTERTGADNPIQGQSVGGGQGQSAPTLADVDEDGDLDIAFGTYSVGTRYYENTGSATQPAFVLAGSTSPVSQIGFQQAAPAFGDLDGDGDPDAINGNAAGQFDYYQNAAGRFLIDPASPIPAPLTAGPGSAPALGDLDDDGDLDAVVGGIAGGAFAYYENTGLFPTSPNFVQQTGAADPLDGEATGGTNAPPTLGDLDDDDDLDLIAGDVNGTFYYFENTGTASSPAFTQRTLTDNPLNGEDVGSGSSPTLGDLDGDGDLDVVSGATGGNFVYYENTGSASSPTFTLQTGAANPLDGFVGPNGFTKPTLADADGDGDLDMVGGDRYRMLYYENIGSPTTAVFLARVGDGNPKNPVDFGYQENALSALGDLDADGDLDILAGKQYGVFFYAENTTIDSTPIGTELAGSLNPLSSQSGTHPALADVDGDGDPDVFSGRANGTFGYWENTGSATRPTFVERTGAANPLDGEQLGNQFSSFNYSSLSLGDLDGDGDLDIVAGASQLDEFTYYENTGDATSPTFVEQTGAANPFNPFVGGNPAFGDPESYSLVDLDGDGDLDLVTGDRVGTFFYFENTGSALAPTFVQRTGGANPLNGFDLPGATESAQNLSSLGDVDGDGDLDVVAGNRYGDFHYFENVGSATAPGFVERFGSGIPLDGDFGTSVAFELGDIDGDGDLDIVSGDGVTSALRTFVVPEPAQGLMLVAGAALLGLLDRLRGRRRA